MSKELDKSFAPVFFLESVFTKPGIEYFGEDGLNGFLLALRDFVILNSKINPDDKRRVL